MNWRFFTVSLPVFWLCISACAQQTSQAPAPPENSAQEKKIEKKEQSQRVLGVLPQFTVTDRKNAPPLTPKGKFRLFYKTAFDPADFAVAGIQAGISQAEDSFPAYGQGASGYAKRYGTFYADTGIGTLMTTSVFPTLLHQDPRYFQLGSGGIWHRTMYSVSRIFVARTDKGDLQFNSSEIAGNAVAAGISNTYHLQNQRTLGNTLGVWGTDIMLNAVCNVAKEFWPDLRRKFRKPKSE